jgi:hypothetical protein
MTTNNSSSALTTTTTPNDDNNTIEVSAAEFARTNRGLITVLKAVQKHGDEGIPTRKLLHNEIKMIGYGETLIKRAEALGYIRREEREPESGRGFHPVYNIITPKGQAAAKPTVFLRRSGSRRRGITL